MLSPTAAETGAALPLFACATACVYADHVSRYSCSQCKEPIVPDLQILAGIVGGPRWWMADVAMSQADAIHRLQRAGTCDRHAILIADLVGAEMRRELSFRSVAPGTVEVRRVTIADPPFDRVSGKRFRKALAHLRNFVAGTPLAAVIEHDREEKRIRVTFQLVSDAGQPGATMDMETIRGMSSRHLIELMRDTERRRLERAG